jgi:hypothetical protein
MSGIEPPADDADCPVEPWYPADVAHVTLGFRAWAWDPARQLLVSPQHSDVTWLPGQDRMAECPRHKKHSPAQQGCSCGVYGAIEVEAAAPYSGIGSVFGLVWGFGTVVPAERGFRAGLGRIAAILAVVPEVSLQPYVLWKIADLYRVPLLTPHTTDVDGYRDPGDPNRIADPDAELRRMTGG